MNYIQRNEGKEEVKLPPSLVDDSISVETVRDQTRVMIAIQIYAVFCCRYTVRAKPYGSRRQQTTRAHSDVVAGNQTQFWPYCISVAKHGIYSNRYHHSAREPGLG